MSQLVLDELAHAVRTVGTEMPLQLATVLDRPEASWLQLDTAVDSVSESAAIQLSCIHAGRLPAVGKDLHIQVPCTPECLKSVAHCILLPSS